MIDHEVIAVNEDIFEHVSLQKLYCMRHHCEEVLFTHLDHVGENESDIVNAQCHYKTP